MKSKTSHKGIIVRIIKSRLIRIAAFKLALLMLFNIGMPSLSHALSGGPSQPEVSGFQPIGTSDMVDLFTGDFKYNIPIMDMDGYPLNLAYSGGSTMDQEASWVGLGWSLNPGVINRNMRGIPDDFKGDKVTKEFNLKANRTYSLNAGATLELFGFDADHFAAPFSGTLSYNVGVNYNTYYGIGIEQSLGLNFKATAGPLTGSLGLTASSENGFTVSPNVKIGLKVEEKRDKQNNTFTSNSITMSIGGAFNSRAGVKQLDFGVSGEKTYGKDVKQNGGGNKTFTKSEAADIGLASGSFDLGLPTYSPSVGMPMHNVSISGNFQVGAAFFGTHPSGYIGATYTGQKLITNTQSNEAFGYMNLEAAKDNDYALLDFNRENDGEVTPVTPNLPTTNLTYDYFSVSGQGVGGSYRPFRSEIGYVHDPYAYTTSEGYNIGIEVGGGSVAHVAGDLTVNSNSTYSGRWTQNNLPSKRLSYGNKGSNPDHETVYFKEANEKSVDSDENYYTRFGGKNAARFKLNQLSKYNVRADNEFEFDETSPITVPTVNHRTKRDKRNQVIYQLTREEINAGLGLENAHGSLYNPPSGQTNAHHIAEITSYGNDGMRYVYGIAAYNTLQQDVSFAVGKGLYGSDPGKVTGTTECSTGRVSYDAYISNSKDNKHGLDNFYSMTETPAYAHSYLLTAVLSPDYVDSDNTKGPSEGDLGYYTKFSYVKLHSDFEWRTPIEQNQANYNEGLKSDDNDDRANYIYGKKEIWYIDKIESKNYIAVFITENRRDGLGVVNENGGADATKPLKLLRKIEFYSRKDYYTSGGGVNPNRTPIKVANFEYDYSLCTGIPNNSGAVASLNPAETGTGKLTLKKVYFTYQKSNKARLSPYQFTYNSSTNYSYNAKAYDRWGNYKATSGSCGAYGVGVTAAEFPYVDQNQTTANNYTMAWNLSQIQLPSGGKINITYESDDYAYVQDKQAMQMFKLVGWGGTPTSPVMPSLTTPLGITNKDNEYMFFELHNGVTDINKYIQGVDKVYFRCMMKAYNIANAYEYVSGYAELDKANCGTYPTTSPTHGYIKLKGVKFDDNDINSDKNPIVRAAVQFSRLHLSRRLYGDAVTSEPANFGEAIITELLSSTASMASSLAELVQGPNDYAFTLGAGKGVVLGKSWIRLNNPDKRKLGGGYRVSKIEMTDEWSGMGGSSTSSYGQEYDYVLEDGVTSSGVAAYEPQMGGEENPFKQPITYDIKNALAPDEKMYQEEPIGESFFPSPQVGYSRVTVKNIARAQVTKHATGKVVHEFYTAKDFPTIAKRTSVNAIPEQQDPFSIASLLNVRTKSFLTATQGFSVECNDMHGKPKKQMVYQENQSEPITSVEYKYKSSPYGTSSFVLNNSITAIKPDGTQTTATVGQFFDMVADMREERSFGQSCKLMMNLDGFVIVLVPVAIPTLWPSFTSEETQYRSATTTKVIQRFGILEETIARDLGSVVSTKNLAYDSETGEVLVTQTTTDFNDAVYTLNYPAHWYYEKGMGQAYKNIGMSIGSVNFSGAGVATYTNAATYFVPGDEIKLSNNTRAWIIEVGTNSIKAVKKDGSAVAGNYSVKVIRSGRRNLAAASVSSVTTLTNPLTNFSSNLFNNVLQASAVEYSDNWRTFCDCFGTTEASSSINPYVLGSKGNWRVKKSLLHLSPRTQSNYNDNTHIRKDGMFTSYTPYYKLAGGKWQVDEKNWTFTSEVTEFSPFGQELENKDALGRYSAATFGYRQTFATSVAANAKYKDIGYDNFEDYGFSPCADNHFKFTSYTANVNGTKSHSGNKSMKVSSGTPVKMNKTLTVCAPVNCNLSLSSVIYSSLNKEVFTIAGGTGPYEITYNVIYGTPEVNLMPDGFILIGTAYKVEVTVTDSEGCKLYKTVVKA